MTEPNTDVPYMEPRPEEPQKTKAPSRPPTQSRNSSATILKKTKGKGDDPLQALTRWLLDNQTGLAFNLIALLFLAHSCIPKARPYTSKFFRLPHYNPNTGKYAAGHDDFCFMTFCIVLLTGLRAGFMEYVLAPLARLLGLSKTKEVTRFSEQAWMLMYYSVFWPLGMYIYYKSPYFLNMHELWTDWPQRELDGLMKGYILWQWSFWIQQVVVINIEDRRKDHWQMLTHHFVTIALISASYAYHQTRVGNQILVMIDVVDLIFPGPFPIPQGWSHLLDPFRHPTGTVCFNDNIMLGFLSYLLILQVMMLVWSVFIIRVAVRVLNGKGAEDIRSDNEEEENGEEEEFEYEEARPLEEEVGVEAIDLTAWERRTAVKMATSSSGASLPGHIDHKELLHRIGCKKQID
ncbi:uncharacterized protein BP5553_08453 [Venustampulla echinocandica]|uniref:TLC domain-containing protein n=1 Tax=Venustampulla echinocandica TaxID=2656787 RepID=A0A370TE96_9HELO|nr:uncharacterized protein BP5553_08453 [Venustampulla echinocandica]RDL33014.1 hypothetical protein BP5553_08453 [Venustampulla echinocandica]